MLVIVIGFSAITDQNKKTCQAVRTIDDFIVRVTKHPNDPAIDQFRDFLKENC